MLATPFIDCKYTKYLFTSKQNTRKKTEMQQKTTVCSSMPTIQASGVATIGGTNDR